MSSLISSAISALGSRTASSEFAGFWQDGAVKFDIGPRQFTPCQGETVIDSINAVEDTKGNNGVRGKLTITNLRLLWASHKNPRINLSIGLNCVCKCKIKAASSKLRGRSQALFVIAMTGEVRFEFIFTSLVNSSPRIYTTVLAVERAYNSSRLYRELKLRGALIKNHKLKTLPGEEIYDKVSGVWNLSSDQGNLGTFFVTNIRIVWFAKLATNFNVSIPYLRVKLLKLRDSKFGKALVVETNAKESGYVLGFRVDPPERLASLFETLQNTLKIYQENPNFGIQVSHEEVPQSLDKVKQPAVAEDLNYEDESELGSSFIASTRGDRSAYVCEEGKDDSESPVPEYNSVLGLAIQPLGDGES
eukprot:CAMPEP_0203759718 /NCGR_PEP_ID=MMETSP0098-20131031/12852_1 /ASSEMBLY_ACC=CAM_ASM_000208 /TAXON_ID=96639 /ORGANISM=" , Strain NY0313808BC1" /LENGTH=360 /DNA_ID=CAMNT_0050652871 /DNA_START=172 /DNA_END=1250 /DNA_ORIENTATION=+